MDDADASGLGHRIQGEPEFDAAFCTRLNDLFVWRRDVRRFRSDPLPQGTLERLLAVACLAPSVGLSQPWRFVIVDDPQRRQAVLNNFLACNAEALGAYTGDAAQRYASLKLAGLQEAPCHLAVFTDHATDLGAGLGRRTMPEMADYSTVSAIATLWLAARAEGIGLGWVSILDPHQVADALDVPAAWRLIGYLCIGYPMFTDDTPELERAGWERRRTCRDHILQR